MELHPLSTDARHALAFRAAAAFVACLLLVSCQPRGDVSDGVQLLLTTREFQANTTFELRFEQDMVGQEALGKLARLSPLHVEPMLKGVFTWLTPRSGIYSPTEAPRLGTSYHFRLASGLQNAAGQSAKLGLSRTLTTPPFQISNLRTSFKTHRHNSARPHISIEFNAPVSAADLRDWLVFRNGEVEIAAKVFAYRQEYLSGFRTDHELGKPNGLIVPDWLTAFNERNRPQPAKARREIRPSNAVSVMPAEPLPLGGNWELVIQEGLPSTWQSLRLAESASVRIGEVTSMAVTRVLAENEFNKGKRVRIDFTQRPGSVSDPQTVLERIKIEPAPENLRLEPNWRSIEIAGDFQLAQEYAITVHDGIRSNSGELTQRTFHTNIVFDPLPPQVRFPAERTVVAAKGAGVFEMIGVNTRGIRLRAKQLTANNVIHAFRGFSRVYQKYWNPDPVQFDLLAGRSLGSRTLYASAEPDVANRMAVNLSRQFGLARGIFFLDASPQRPKRGFERSTQAIVQLTDIGLVWKQHSEGLLVHAFSLETGQPLAGADVMMMSDDNGISARARTDSNGEAHLRRDADPWLLVQHQGDLLVMQRHRSTMSRYGFGIPTTYRTGAAYQPRILLFRDKPVVKPGDTIRFKAIGRMIGTDTKALTSEEHGQARLSISDNRGRNVLRTNLAFSTLGSSDFAFTAPANRHGRYHVGLSFADTSAHVSFLVQDYEPNAFEVMIGGRSHLTATNDFDFPVTASYLLGKELSSARLQWSLEAREFRFRPDGFDEFLFCNSVHDDRILPGPTMVTRNGAGRYAGGTPLVIRTNIPANSSSPFPRDITVTAEVTDLNQQTITATRTVRSDSSEFYLGLGKTQQRPKAGETFLARVIAVDRHGKPLTNRIDADIRLRRINWHSVRVKGSGNTISYRNEWRGEDLISTNLATLPLARLGTKWEPVGKGLRLPPFPAAGLYILEAETQDSAGNKVFSAMALHVAGADHVAWDYRNAAQIELIPDKESYAPGEMAEVFIKTPISGRALVSIECNSIHRSFTTNLTGNTPSVRVSLDPLDAPNVFASVTLLRGSSDSPLQFKEPDYRYGYCQLNVSDPESRLEVAIDHGRTDYRPGEQVKVDVTVRNQAGRPVRNAEVSLYAVDEGVLGLTGYATPDPYGFFNKPRPLAVSSHISLPKLLPENPAKLRFENKGRVIGGGGRAPLPIRKNFVACPLWEPALKTDKQGRVSASFIAPDGLSRYRIVATVHDGRDRFGNASADVKVNKPLIIEPVLPRFARRGDRITARALVINRSGKDAEVNVTWKRRGKALTTGPGTQITRLSIKSNETRTVAFPMKFTEVGEADWTWSVSFVKGDGFSDSVVSQLPVEEPIPLLRALQIGQIRGSTNLLAPIDPLLLRGEGTVTVRISNSPYLELRGGMDYLLHYPYGCVEQTSSSLLPWLLLKRDPVLRELLGESQNRVDDALKTGIDRLLAMQNSSGGLGYWPGDRRPQPWGSAFGALILTLAQRNGIAIPARAMDRMQKYLAGTIRNRDQRTTPPFNSSHALALYVLGLLDQPDPGALRQIHDQRGMLSAETCTLAALATLISVPNSRDQAQRLLEQAAATRDQTYGTFGSRGRLLSFELMAHRRMNSDRAGELTRTLLNRRTNGRWLNTQENAWALLALARTDADLNQGEIPLTLSWGESKQRLVLGKTPALIEKKFELSKARSTVPLMLKLPAAAGLYAQVEVAARVEQTSPAIRDRGFVVERTYRKLDANGESSDSGTLAIGDTVLVTLDFKANEAAGYVAIEDPLPALLEAINPDFKSQKSAAGKNAVGWTSSYRELRRDRALFFRNRLPTGTHQIRYLARVRAEGEATAGPTKVEKMYEPERYGLGAVQILKAKK